MSTPKDSLRNEINLESKNQPFNNRCSLEEEVWLSSFFGVTLALPEWEAVATVIMLSIIIVLTIVGNILVILSVFTYKPLRIVQNFFIVSLAIADLTVALLVLPLNVAYSVLGRWEFGIHLCKLWLTCDVMCCTSSILNLCVIALDRYWAITDPINYAHKRTVTRVLFLISGVWILSLIISSPPLVGWNDWPREFLITTPCELTSNRGYVIYSSLGSFFIPLIIMTTVYVKIYIAAKRRLRERSVASKTYNVLMKTKELQVIDNNAIVQEMSKPFSSYSSFLCCKKSFNLEDSPFENENVSNSSETYAGVSHKGSLHAQQCKNAENTDLNPVKDNHISVSYKISQKIPCKKPAGEKEHILVKEKNIDGISEYKGKESCGNDGILNKNAFSQPFIKVGDSQVNLEDKTTGVHQFIEEKQKISLSKERRAARTLGIIMGVFVICWLPFFLMYVILPFCRVCCPTQKFKNFITWLGYINSSLNPVIYTIFNLDFRRAFKKLLSLK